MPSRSFETRLKHHLARDVARKKQSLEAGAASAAGMARTGKNGRSKSEGMEILHTCVDPGRRPA